MVKRSEIVLAFVGPVGVPSTRFHDAAKEHLEKALGYTAELIKLSEHLDDFKREGLLDTRLSAANEYERIKTHMDAGDELRQLDVTFARGLLANAAAAKIASLRKRNRHKQTKPMPRRAWLISSLKNPAEVLVLRQIYGQGFYLIGLYATRSERKNALKRHMSAKQAEELINRDEASEKKHGQQTSLTFELADAWVNSEDHLRRVIDLIFGNTLETPTDDENGMALAYTAAIRSSSLSRQVGAAVVSPDGDVLGTGYNEVPAPGGGQYSPPTAAQTTARDCDVGEDSNTKERLKLQDEILSSVSRLLKREGFDVARVAADLQVALSRSGLRHITEYGRAVHAEMSALLSAARVGASVRGATLYCTTFPCHNCAKHIVAAGIERVVFVEPYPKSKAVSLHADSIKLAGEESGDQRLGRHTRSIESRRTAFEPFLGVGPRRYFDLFSMRLGSGYEIDRKDERGNVIKFKPRTATPRVPLKVTTYLEEERLAAELLHKALDPTEEGGRT